MGSYFGKISEENVKNNFVLIYELLDGKLRLIAIVSILIALFSSTNYYHFNLSFSTFLTFFF